MKVSAPHRGWDLRSGYALPSSHPLCGKDSKPGRTPLIVRGNLSRRPGPALYLVLQKALQVNDLGSVWRENHQGRETSVLVSPGAQLLQRRQKRRRLGVIAIRMLDLLLEGMLANRAERRQVEYDDRCSRKPSLGQEGHF